MIRLDNPRFKLVRGDAIAKIIYRPNTVIGNSSGKKYLYCGFEARNCGIPHDTGPTWTFKQIEL